MKRNGTRSDEHTLPRSYDVIPSNDGIPTNSLIGRNIGIYPSHIPYNLVNTYHILSYSDRTPAIEHEMTQYIKCLFKLLKEDNHYQILVNTRIKRIIKDVVI